MNVLASGYKILGVNPLPEEEALARGINFLSESFVFVVAGSIIIIEYARSEAKSALKAQQAAEAEAQFRQYLESKFDALSSDIQILNERIKNLEIAAEEQVRSFCFLVSLMLSYCLITGRKTERNKH